MAFKIMNDSIVFPDFHGSAVKFISSIVSISSNLTQLVPRPRNNHPSSCRRHIQGTNVLQKTDETEIWLIPWILQIEYIDVGGK